MRHLTLQLALLTLFSACGEKKNTGKQQPADPGAAPSLTAGAPPAASQDSQWVVEGDYTFIEGRLTTAGGSGAKVYAGEKLVAYLNLKGFIIGEPITSHLTLTGPEGVVFEKKATLLAGDKVKRGSGVLAVSCGTLSSWVRGAYTFNVEISQSKGARRGRFYIPLQLEGLPRASQGRFTLVRLQLPHFLPAGQKSTVWGLLRGVTFTKGGEGVVGEVGLEYAYQAVTKGSPAQPLPGGRLEFLRWTGSSARTYLWGSATIQLPASPGKYLLRLTFTDAAGSKKVVSGENVTVVKNEPGLFNIVGLDPNGVPRAVWHRNEQGSISLAASGLSSDSALLDYAVLGPRGGAFMIKRDARLTLRGGAGNFRLPFTVPEFAPQGDYKVLLRIKEGSTAVERIFPFSVSGSRLRLTNQMRVYGLELVQGLPVFLSKKRGSLVAGKKTRLSFIVSGFIHGKEKKKYGPKEVEVLKVGIGCTLSLANPLLEEPLQKEPITSIDKTVFNGVNMLRVNAEFKLKRVPPGRYVIRIDCTDRHGTGASQLMRHVNITQ